MILGKADTERLEPHNKRPCHSLCVTNSQFVFISLETHVKDWAFLSQCPFGMAGTS